MEKDNKREYRMNKFGDIMCHEEFEEFLPWNYFMAAQPWEEMEPIEIEEDKLEETKKKMKYIYGRSLISYSTRMI